MTKTVSYYIVLYAEIKSRTPARNNWEMNIFGRDKHDFAPLTGRPMIVKADEKISCDCPQTCAITKLIINIIKINELA